MGGSQSTSEEGRWGMIVFHGFVETDLLNTEKCIKYGDHVYTVLSSWNATEWDVSLL